MKKKSASRSAFFNLRVLIGLCLALGGVALGLAQIGVFSAVAANDVQAKVKNRVITQSMDPLVPAMFDCSRFSR
jgi:hypothetical protein